MLRLTACAAALLAFCATARASEPSHSAELDEMIVRQAQRHGVPEKLVRRIVMRESKYNPRARNHAFWGLMQISYPTAKSMGFKGSPSQLLDPLVNLTYAVPYLANAFIIAGKQEDAAVRLYASGYYETAKSRNLLDGLRTADSKPVGPDDGLLYATTKPVSNLITAVVEGPPGAAVAAPSAPPVVAEAAPALPSAALAGGGGDQEPDVMMTVGKTGNELPKKWIKDGGMTVIARGEQRVDQVAAYGPSESETPAGSAKSAHRTVALHGKLKKTIEFASLDAPPASAQAYAPTGADPRDATAAQTGPQAAIAQVTAGPSSASDPVAAEPAAEPKPAKTVHKAHLRKLAVAKSESGDATGPKPASDALRTADAGTSAASPSAVATKPNKQKHPHVATAKTKAEKVVLAARPDEMPATTAVK